MDISRVKWQEFVSGNDDSYCWIYTTYAQKLYQYGMCFTTDTELVKDCIQDIFTYLYRNYCYYLGNTYGYYLSNEY